MEEKSNRELPKEYHPNQVFHVELTHEQSLALALVLPQHYSFQIQPRKKDNKSQIKKKTADELLLSSYQPLPSRAKQPAVVHQLPPPPPPTKKAPPKQQMISEALKPCLKTLQSLQQHKCALPFLVPVDVQALNIPEYLEIVKQPMDLSTIESKLKGGKYQNPAQFHHDVIKIFHNSYLFNSANQDFVKLTVEFERYYYRISGEQKPPVQKQVTKQPLLPSKSQKKKKKPPTGSRQFNDSQPITTEEKKELACQIHRLAKEHIKGIKNIVFESNSDQNQFDLEQLSQKKLRELQKYVRNKIAEMQNNLRTNMLQKGEEQNLDQLESQITEQFIDQSLGQKMQVEE